VHEHDLDAEIVENVAVKSRIPRAIRIVFFIRFLLASSSLALIL